MTDEVLANAFRHKYPSFAKAKVGLLGWCALPCVRRADVYPRGNTNTNAQVIRDKYKGKSKGFGFVSFLDPFEGLKGA